MKDRTLTVTLFSLASLFFCSALGVIAYIPEGELTAAFASLLATFTTTTTAVIVVIGLALGLATMGGAAYFLWRAYNAGAIAHYNRRQAAAAAERAALEASALITVAGPGEQVYLTRISDRLKTDPLHLQPGRLNGRPSAFTPDEARRYELFNIVHSKAASQAGRLTDPDRPQLEAGHLPPLIPALQAAQRLLIVGGSGAGKTTAMLHLIQARRAMGDVLAIDPHGSPPKYGDIASVGAGRDYESIEQTLNRLLLLMTQRYQEIGAGRVMEGQHPLLSVFVDEWTSIAKKIEQGGDKLATLLTESRKANIHMVVCSHTDQVKTLGIEGQGQLRASFTIARLTVDRGQRRAFIEPTDPKADPAEYAPPPPFEGPCSIPDPAAIALPPPPTVDQLAIIDALRADPEASNYGICKAAGLSTGGSAYAKIEEVRALFGPF